MKIGCALSVCAIFRVNYTSINLEKSFRKCMKYPVLSIHFCTPCFLSTFLKFVLLLNSSAYFPPPIRKEA